MNSQTLPLDKASAVANSCGYPKRRKHTTNCAKYFGPIFMGKAQGRVKEDYCGCACATVCIGISNAIKAKLYRRFIRDQLVKTCQRTHWHHKKNCIGCQARSALS